MQLVLLRAFAYLTDLILIVSNQQHVILSLRVTFTLLRSPSRAPQSSDVGVCAHIGMKVDVTKADVTYGVSTSDNTL